MFAVLRNACKPLLKITAAHDVGRAINPMLVRGQIEGGIAQGIGMALMEEYLAGRTPNPCVMCNTHIKWRALLKQLLSRWSIPGTTARASTIDQMLALGRGSVPAGDQTDLPRIRSSQRLGNRRRNMLNSLVGRVTG